MNKLIFLFVASALGHGTLMYPPMRGSMWRFYRGVPSNYDDNGLNCGGNFSHCGICGDDPHGPQRHSRHGGYGLYSARYRTRFLYGQPLETTIKITANHGGYIHYHVCSLDQSKPENEQCFRPFKFFFYLDRVPGQATIIHHNLGVLNYRCGHCVLRMTWVTGSNWDPHCRDQYTGCGRQEIFRNCADFSVE